jgi:hypothetical protein
MREMGGRRGLGGTRAARHLDSCILDEPVSWVRSRMRSTRAFAMLTTPGLSP